MDVGQINCGKIATVPVPLQEFQLSVGWSLVGNRLEKVNFLTKTPHFCSFSPRSEAEYDILDATCTWFCSNFRHTEPHAKHYRI